MIWHILSEQLKQPPDRKIRLLLLCMVGLMAFLLIDWVYTNTQNTVKNIQTDIDSIQDTILTNEALANQLPALISNVQKMKQELQWLQEKASSVQEGMFACQERDVLRILQQTTNDDGPFSGFTVNTANSNTAFRDARYHIRFEQQYETVLKGLLKMDQSICSQNITLLEMKKEEEQGMVSGFIQVRINKKKVQNQ